MAFLNIAIENFRNLTEQKIDFSPHINIVNGMNGSGKSSLLESLYYLSVGKSFRSTKLDAIICHQSAGFTLFALTGNDQHRHRVGVIRERNRTAQIKIDGDYVRSAIQLANLTPTLLIDPETFELLDGGPGNRRRYLDWGVFHVEHRFARVWKNYTKSLKQRNTLLRRGRIEKPLLASWDNPLIETAEQIDTYRQAYIVALVPVINKVLGVLNQSMKVDISYYRGWDKNTDFGMVLQQSFPRDSGSGYTNHGPHRADIRIKVDGRHAEDILSRGQKKILIFAMILAQGSLLNERHGRNSVYLIDDISAELDVEHRRNICAYLETLESQVIMTVVDAETITPYFSEETEKRMFHVEHGRIVQNN